MTAFPSSIVSFSTKIDGQVIYAVDINNPQNEIVALETKIGVDNSAVATSLDYLVKNAGSSGGGHVQQPNTGGTGQTSFNKGDILIASSSSVLSKLTVGPNGYGLTANSNATAGVDWEISAGLSSFSLPFTASSVITGINPVCIKSYQSDGGIKYANSAVWTQTPSVSGTFTVSSALNRMLVAFVELPSSSGVPSVTYASSAMTQVGTVVNGGATTAMYAYLMKSPPTSVATFAVTNQSATQDAFVYEYDNVAQTNTPDAVGGSSNSQTVTITTVANGALIIGGGKGTTLTSGLPNNQNLNNNGVSVGDSGTIFPAQSNSFTVGGSSNLNIGISLAPFTVPDFRVQMASSATSVLAGNFIGFSTSSANSGSVVQVTINGAVTGLSSLQSSGQYYLNDAVGTFSTIPGTITKKIGTAISSVALLLTNT